MAYAVRLFLLLDPHKHFLHEAQRLEYDAGLSGYRFEHRVMKAKV